jgi:hypothetical protein
MSAIDDPLSLSHRVQSARASKEEDKEEEKGGKIFGEKKGIVVERSTKNNEHKRRSLSLSFPRWIE